MAFEHLQEALSLFLYGLIPGILIPANQLLGTGMLLAQTIASLLKQADFCKILPTSPLTIKLVDQLTI
ncbi:MAG: hypothetical protein A3D24_01255 [Candidatus Blackburnbacteria bacterium RIFCSPHIGHO2_02_FULL_39_13]|nr:MAG: hypothetical protein A3D24_01255 [Candidatus Blackburnbacteria bacterium RIFCSPHIGHO2_02_FULL_39_13]